MWSIPKLSRIGYDILKWKYITISFYSVWTSWYMTSRLNKQQYIFLFKGIYSLHVWWHYIDWLFVVKRQLRGISTIFIMKRYERGMAIIWILYTLVRSLVQDLFSTWKDTTYDHLYAPLFVNTSSFPHSWLITGCVTKLTLRVSLVEQELLNLTEYLSLPLVFSVVSVTRSLVICVSFVDRWFSFSRFSFGHCVICFTDSDYFFWHLQTLLTVLFIVLEYSI